MRKMKLLFSVGCLAAIALTSCGGSNEPATAINAEQFDQLRENKENAGKRFSVTGYPYLSGDVTVGNNMNISVELYTEPKGEGELLGSFKLGYKDRKNGMYVPDEFTAEDLQIFDNEGKSSGINDKITISFTMKLDVKRAPITGQTKVVKDENGMMKSVERAPQYYGDGPVDIKIERAN